MRKIFQHENLVRLFAVLALSLALFSFLRPKIDDYNKAVEVKQKELRIQADGAYNRGFSFDVSYINDSVGFYAEVILSLGLFFSLLITKRIIFSFLSVILFVFQFGGFLQIFYSTVDFPASYFLNCSLLPPAFVACTFALCCWQSAVICRLVTRQSKPDVLSKKKTFD